MRKLLISLIGLGAILSLIILTGCSDGLYTGDASRNRAPEVWLSSGPVEGDTTGYQVHFYWSGWDPDGEVSHFEFCIVEGGSTGIGFNPADTSGADKWLSTTAHDSIFRVKADENPQPYDINNPNSMYTRYDKTHTLFIRSVDLRGKGSEVEFRSFTAWTIAPICFIEQPPLGTNTYSTVITFRWTARDPVDSPSNSQDPDSIRYLVSKVLNREGIYQPEFLIIDNLNENPQDYEELWSDWIWYRAPGDSGKTTKIGDNEPLEINKQHIFAVQAKDEAGAVTAIFRRNTNVKQFGVSWNQGPLLRVSEPFLGGFQFIGILMNPIQKRLPPGVPLNFCWEASAANYGGEIVGYRYGWDIQDLEDPNQWEGGGSFNPYLRCAKERTLFAGIHMFTLQVKDDGNRITMANIEIEIIQFSMERELLWVDDVPLTDLPNSLRTMPTETEHDEFWLDICGRVEGFLPDRDVYDVKRYSNVIPPIETIGRYANIIWIFSNSTDGAWKQILIFTPESMIGPSSSLALNYLSLFLAKGGHLLTAGVVDRGGGGLTAAFPTNPLLPASFKADMSTDPEDTSGTNSMPYKDLCVTVVDKVSANFRTDDEMPPDVFRTVDRDAMRYGVKKVDDPVVAEHLGGFPEQMRLWSGITCTSCFFNPLVRGFTYVEVYDPKYYMDFKLIPFSQGCFHPTYTMKARSVLSPLDNQAIAIVVTKYRDKFYGREDITFIPAYSFHFGFPLWFFNRDDVNQAIDVIFNEWQLNPPGE